MRPVCHPHGHVLMFFIFAKSNEIPNMFVKSILVKKIALTSICDIMSPEHFEIENKDYCPL